MPEEMADGGRKLVTLDDLIDALDKRERAPSNAPKVDTFHFKGERVSDWLDLTEQALVGLSDEVKLQRVLRYVLHSHQQEVGKVVDAANGSWARFRDMMQRKYRLGDDLLTMADLEAMNKDDFSTIGAFVHEFKRKARKVHEISEETQCAIFLCLLTGSEASELTGHGGGNEKLTWATIDKGVEEGSLDQVRQHQVWLQRRKKKERDATASGTPGVKRIVTDVLAALGYDNEAEVQKRGVTVAQGRASGAVEEEARREDYGGEETGSQILTKAQRKQRNLQVGGQGSEKGQVPQAIAAPPPAATTTSATAGPSCMGPPAACGHWEKEKQTVRVEEIVGDSEEVTQWLKAGTIREEPIVVESDDERQKGEGEPTIVLLGRMEDLLEKDDDEEDERLRQEEDQRAELRAKKRGGREEAEPSLPDNVPQRKKYAVRMEEGLDVERMVDKLLEDHNDLINLKDILASAPRLRGELKGRLSRRLVPNVHLSTVLSREVEWTEAETRMDWKCVACGQVDLVIKNQKCTGMVDTGTEMNINREKEAVMIGMKIDRLDHGMLHGANCKAAFCGTTSNVIIEIGKMRARTCFFVMPDIDHPILLGQSFLCRTEMLIFNKHDGTMILLLCDPACGNYEVITCRNTGPGSGRNRPNLGSFTFEESENERRRLWEVPEEKDRAEVLTLSLTDVDKAMEVVSAHNMADPEAIKALREQVLENPQVGEVELVYQLPGGRGGPAMAQARATRNKNRADGLSRINWDGSDEESIEDTPPVDGFLDQEEDVRLHINEWSLRVPSCVSHPIWLAPMGYEQKKELVLKPFQEEDPWGSKDVGWMMKLALAGTHSLVEEVRTIEEGPTQVEEHEQLMRGMYLLTNTLLQGDFDRKGSFSHEEGEILVPESQDDEFEEVEIKEAFRAEEYDGVYRELGLLLSREMRDREEDEAPLCAQRPGEPLHPRLEREVGAVVHLDLLFMPAGENGCNYIFDARDNLTGFVDGRAIWTKNGPILANCIEEYYLRYPFVKEFVMDRGSEFTCNEVRTLLARYGVVTNYTTVAHPQANAPVKRGHSTITNLLAKWTEGEPGQWPKFLWAAIFVENVTVKSTTNFALATLWYGRHTTFPIESFMKTWRRQDLEVNLSFEELLDIRARQVGAAEERLREAAGQVERSRMEDKMRWDQTARVRKEPLAVGDVVLLYDSSLEKQWSRKLDKRWMGPYRILRCDEFGAHQIEELDGTGWQDWVSGTRLKKYDFSKTAMQRGGRGARPRQRPQGTSGGDDSHRPFGRESTPIFDDDNIELFLDSYQAHVAREGWSTLERIQHLRGVGRLKEPIAHIREEALTWQDVEARMQMLRASPLGPDGLPIRLEEGNVEEFIPAYEHDLRGPSPTLPEGGEAVPFRTLLDRLEAHLDASQWGASQLGADQSGPARYEPVEDEPEEEPPEPGPEARSCEPGEPQTKGVMTVGDDTPPPTPIPKQARQYWPEGVLEPDSEEMLGPPSETTTPPPTQTKPEEGEGARTPTTMVPHLTEPTGERMNVEVPTSGEPPPEPPPTEEGTSERDPLREARGARARRPSGEKKEEKCVRMQVRLEELYQEKIRMEAAGETPKPPIDPPTSEQRISKANYEGERDAARLRSREVGQENARVDEARETGDLGLSAARMGIERADRRIGEVAISFFQRYSMLSDELAASRLEVGQLSTQLGEERAENQAWRSRMQVKEAEWEKRLQDMAAMVERLSATKMVDWTEQSRYGIQGKEVQGLFGREGTTEPPQQGGMRKVFLDPIEAAAQREAEEGRFSFRTLSRAAVPHPDGER
ncbi:hypothetical protein CBR_g24378 [Chara braunii]|uniref:Integrase catalytic domain-containing protein n=1 Tax=Chara braunii TaxID=69332 RepID=A0A388JMN4_CHABU|nr:hypothetical protein CBR_g24378 [Chara braunii]|eukprot:GBG59031.1 hypothetical protein CBR_g24378 [Chara braunii]